MVDSLVSEPTCCECIMRLQPSSLRSTYSKMCKFLNVKSWSMVCRYFLRMKLLQEGDMEAIMQASKLQHALPSQEIILRLEKKSDFNVGTLLDHLKSACEESQYVFIVSLFNSLHTRDCVKLVKSKRSLPAHELGEPNCLVSDSFSSNPGLVLNELYPSMNNLSDPFKPYLHITQHPTGETLVQGEDLLLKCVAESDAPIKYSWRRNGQTIVGHNGKILLIPDVQYYDCGEYVCVVKTEAFEMVSDPAKVVIDSSGESAGNVCLEQSPALLFYATEKFALLIANEHYIHNPPLSSASNDVQEIANKLKMLEFKTITLLNLTCEEMKTAVNIYCSYLINGAYCVTYLAGHGFESDGQCYIVPVDAPKRYSPDCCFSIKNMIESIRSSCDLSLAVFLLDVCRTRLNYNDNSARPIYSSKNFGNFVISYATMEEGMAYEVKNHKLGVYASSLSNYLSEDKLVTRVIELVHRDIHINGSTNGVQRPEFISNIFEDRKLTDPIHFLSSTPKEYRLKNEWWKSQAPQKPSLYIFESCGVLIELIKNTPFSNLLSLDTNILENRQAFKALIALKGHQMTHKKILIQNVQRLNNEEVHFALQLQSQSGVILGTCEDSISIPFVSWWKCCIA